jgi:hypothetical protein
MAILNNTKVVKPSSLTTSGLISTKYPWIRRPQPITWWKPNPQTNKNTHSYYVSLLSKKTILEGDNCHAVDENPPKSCCAKSGWIYNYPPITKPAKSTGAIDASEYINKVDVECGILNTFYIKKNTKHAPFACGKVA